MESLVVALRVALSLAVVFGLIWYIHRRLTRGGKARLAATPITVLGKQAVGQKASVVVVDADGKRFILGVTEHSITVIHGGVAPAAAFADVLAETTPAETETDTETDADTSETPAPRPVAVAARTAAAPTETGLVAPGSRLPGALGGSILSPSTWRQAAAVLGRNR
ncbi:flagellar protein FliO/FliZ [Conyzicola nivalis]|uniref:Flagellar protein n=1 Tax=Conyzicola nivalis TaxID=1477021 RepID=A0ABV2QSL0_9MICO